MNKVYVMVRPFVVPPRKNEPSVGEGVPPSTGIVGTILVFNEAALHELDAMLKLRYSVGPFRIRGGVG